MGYNEDKIYSLFFASEFGTGSWVIFVLNFHGDQWTVQLLSRVSLFATPWIAECQASLSITNSWSLVKLMPIESVMPPNHLILCHWWPLALSLSQHQGLFQWVSSSHKEAKVLALQFRIRPSKKYSESTSFRIDCLISLLANRLSRVFSSTTVWKH